MALRRVFLDSPTKLRYGLIYYSRNLSLWCPPSPPERLPDHVIQEVTKVTRGVGFSVLYSNSSSLLWFCGEDPPISGGRQGNTVQEVWLPEGHVTKSVAVGRRHVVAMTTTGNVFSMGLNCFGQCGFSPSSFSSSSSSSSTSSTSSSSSSDDLLTLQPIHLPLPVTKVCCGLDHTHFLLEDGQLYSCGWSDDGQTGTGCHGSVAPPIAIKSDVMRLEPLRDVHCCADTSIAITDSSNGLYGWGNNEYNQLPIQSHDMQVFVPWRIDPVVADQSDGGEVVAVTTGSSFSAALTQRGDIYVAGRLGGEEDGGGGGGGWRLLHESRDKEEEEEEEVEEIRAGLHYLAAVVSSKCKGQRKVLVWGRPSIGSSSSPVSNEISLPPSLLNWDAGPLDICFLMQ